jgi:hypothetical protein
MTKQVYICGDSFSSTDPEYKGGWVERFQEKHPNLELINLSSPGASNYLIYLQVKQALTNSCQYLIYHATSSIRHEFCIDPQPVRKDSLDRYWNRSTPARAGSMICTSWTTPEHSLILSTQQATQIKNFFKLFIDMPAEIEKNYLFIKSTLELIKQQNVPHWAWSRGGFEHVKFGADRLWDFNHYQLTESVYNLWDHYDSTQIRPFYHISDPAIIENVCNHYTEMLQLT